MLKITFILIAFIACVYSQDPKRIQPCNEALTTYVRCKFFPDLSNNQFQQLQQNGNYTQSVGKRDIFSDISNALGNLFSTLGSDVQSALTSLLPSLLTSLQNGIAGDLSQLNSLVFQDVTVLTTYYQSIFTFLKNGNISSTIGNSLNPAFVNTVFGPLTSTKASLYFLNVLFNDVANLTAGSSLYQCLSNNNFALNSSASRLFTNVNTLYSYVTIVDQLYSNLGSSANDDTNANDTTLVKQAKRFCRLFDWNADSVLARYNQTANCYSNSTTDSLQVCAAAYILPSAPNALVTKDFTNVSSDNFLKYLRCYQLGLPATCPNSMRKFIFLNILLNKPEAAPSNDFNNLFDSILTTSSQINSGSTRVFGYVYGDPQVKAFNSNTEQNCNFVTEVLCFSTASGSVKIYCTGELVNSGNSNATALSFIRVVITLGNNVIQYNASKTSLPAVFNINNASIYYNNQQVAQITQVVSKHVTIYDAVNQITFTISQVWRNYLSLYVYANQASISGYTGYLVSGCPSQYLDTSNVSGRKRRAVDSSCTSVSGTAGTAGTDELQKSCTYNVVQSGDSSAASASTGLVTSANVANVAQLGLTTFNNVYSAGVILNAKLGLLVATVVFALVF